MIAIILVETIIWVPFENSASDLDIHTHIIHYINVPKKDVGIKQINTHAHVIFQTWFISKLLFSRYIELNGFAV